MRNYIKPDISFQSLTLSSSTAGNDCAVQNNSDVYSCKQEIPGLPPEWTIFSTDKDCYFQQGDIEVCYHAPYEGQNIFAS